jgi:hypothetical protein
LATILFELMGLEVRKIAGRFSTRWLPPETALIEDSGFATTHSFVRRLESYVCGRKNRQPRKYAVQPAIEAAAVESKLMRHAVDHWPLVEKTSS